MHRPSFFVVLSTFVAAALILAAGSTAAFAVTKTWTGAVNNLWSTSGNWAGGTPAAGDRIVFGASALNLSNSNDLPATNVYYDITFLGSNYVISGNTIALSNGISSNAAPNTINNNLQITGPQTIGGAICCGPLNLNGNVDLGANTVTFNYQVNALGVISGAGGLALGDVITLSGNNTYTGATTITQRAQIDGLQPGSAVSTVNFYNGTLSGKGTTGAVTLNGGFVAPGQSFGGLVGKLTSGSLVMNAGSYLQAQINGTSPGVNYDQLSVNGTVTLDPSSNLSILLGFTPSLGQQFVILDNDGADPINGTFSGLPQGATLSINANDFQISYVGGTGNDIVLTCTAAARTWTGAASNLWSNPGNWLGGVPGPGDPLVFPAGASNLNNTDDLPAGTAFKLILFTGSNYVISGNSFKLAQGITSNAAPNTINNNIQLTAPQTIGGAICCGPLNLGGNIDLGANLLTMDNQVNSTGVISGTGGLALGDVITLSGNNTYTGATTITQRAQIDGLQPGSTVSTVNFYNGTLSGKGTLGAVTMNGGSLSPGQSFGSTVARLSCGNLAFNTGNLIVQINGLTPGVRHDQVRVTGTVTIAPGTYFNPSLGFVPSVGQSFIIVDNDGADPVSGTFDSLPEGAQMNINQDVFSISYVGGDGNDIALYVVSTAKTWSGAVNNLWSDPGNWIGGVPGPGDPLVFPAGAANLSNLDDLPDGTVFKLISFTGSNYVISGNGFGLTDGISSTAAPNTINNDITVASPQTIGGAYCCGTLNLGGTISLGSNLLTFNYMVNATGVIRGAGGVALGDVVTLSGNNTYTGPTTISQRGEIDGTQPASAVSTTLYYNATVSGKGRTGSITVNSSASISPGMGFGAAPGKLSSGPITMNAGSYLSVQLNGSVPGTGYDQLSVTGAIDLSGSPSLYPTLGFTPALGQVFVIANNDGNDAVSGTFSGMPQGATFNIGPYPFQISYIGKTGNDITLTSLSGDPLNGAPVANSDTYSTIVNTPLTVASPGVLANDTDPDLQPLTVVLADSLTAQGGVAQVAANGGFTYTPPTGFTGADTFNYIISDGHDATDQGTVTINVQPDPAGTPPTAIELPKVFELFAPAPNPSRGAVGFSFALPRSGPVRAEIFDLAGRRVARLAEQAVFSAGIHHLAWDGRTSEGSPAASGVYVIQLAGGPKTATRKFVLLAP